MVLSVDITAFPMVADNRGLKVIHLNCSVEAGVKMAYALGFGKQQKSWHCGKPRNLP